MRWFSYNTVKLRIIEKGTPILRSSRKWPGTIIFEEKEKFQVLWIINIGKARNEKEIWSEPNWKVLFFRKN